MFHCLGEVTDFFGSLTTVIEMDPFEFLEKIAYMLENRQIEYPRLGKQTRDLPEPEFAYIRNGGDRWFDTLASG